MRLSYIFAIAGTFISIVANANTCEIQGQVVVKKSNEQYSLRECLPSIIGGLDSSRPLAGRYIADFLEANTNNAKVKTMLDAVVPGMSMKDIVAALKDGQIFLTADRSDLSDIAELYNERMGVNADLKKIEAKKILDETKKNVSISDLAEIALTNSTILPNLHKNCKSRPNQEQRLRPLVINFADGESLNYLVTGFNKIEDGSYKLSYVSQNNKEEEVRTIEKDGGQLFLVGKDGKKWPLTSKPFTEITDEAAASIRTIGSSAASPNQSASCYLATKLPQIKGKSSDTRAIGTDY